MWDYKWKHFFPLPETGHGVHDRPAVDHPAVAVRFRGIVLMLA
jgi:hypothetical protein